MQLRLGDLLFYAVFAGYRFIFVTVKSPGV